MCGREFTAITLLLALTLVSGGEVENISADGPIETTQKEYIKHEEDHMQVT